MPTSLPEKRQTITAKAPASELEAGGLGAEPPKLIKKVF